MLKKQVAILMLFSALATLLGHNFIAHHHHLKHEKEISFHLHHHSDHSKGKSSQDEHNKNHTNEENKEWSHYLSSIEHGFDGITFLTFDESSNLFTSKFPPFDFIYFSDFFVFPYFFTYRQNAPPVYSNRNFSQEIVPYGLRGPPFYIV
jgi:hypothetical protein